MIDPALLALTALLLPAVSFLVLAIVAPLRRHGHAAAYLSIALSAASLVAAVAAWTLMPIQLGLVPSLVQSSSLVYVSDKALPSHGNYKSYQSLFAFSMMG